MEVLANKKYETYKKISRYSNFPVYYHKLDEKWVGGTTAYLRDDTPYTTYTVVGTESYDILALKFYNNPTLYWIICSFNKIQDPFEKPLKGTVLKIPTMSGISYE